MLMDFRPSSKRKRPLWHWRLDSTLSLRTEKEFRLPVLMRHLVIPVVPRLDKLVWFLFAELSLSMYKAVVEETR